MRLGITMFATDTSMDIVDLARAAEDRGFGSLYLPEHTHIPTSRTTPPPTGDEVLAEEYRRTLDPFVALSAAGAATETLRLGTGVSLVAQRDPIVTAKAVATLDHLTSGRFVFGIGFGWNVEEMADHGVEFSRRRDVVREKMLTIRRLWSDEEATFDGEFVRLAPSWSWPKPVQRPNPPVLIGGGGGPRLFEAIAEYGDGWIPIGGSGLVERIPDLSRAFEAAGRDPSGLQVVPFGTVPDEGKLEHYAGLGITEVVLRIPSAGSDDVLPILDRYAALTEN